MRTLMCWLTLVALVAPVPLLSGHEQKPAKVARQPVEPAKVKVVMRKKLDHAQKILEAIALNDLAKLGQQAEGLLEVRKEAGWLVYKTPEYERNSDDFRRTLEKLVQQAKDKDLESAKLTYLEMTMTCFHCHRYVRDVGMVRFDNEESSR